MLAIVGGLCLVLGTNAVPDAAAASARSDPALSTPLWSARRVPALFGAAVARSSLQRQLATIVGPYASCITVDDAHGAVARVDAGRALAGASTQKLVVAAASLAVLGPDHRFETRAISDAALKDGTLAGDLTIVGGGDPVLTTSSTPTSDANPSTPLAGLADAIVQAGVRRIEGALVADDSRYDRERAVPAWKPSEVDDGEVGALGALVIDRGYAENGIASPDPALDTVEALATLLSARGVEIANGATDPGRAAAPGRRTIARVSSPPLREIVQEMLIVSDNETAELLTRELGFTRGGEGSTAAGTHAISGILARLGVHTNGVDLRDGSGLSPEDRVTCTALSDVVALGSKPSLAPIGTGLPVAGRSGTLAGRLIGTPLAGRLRAKTGHIDGVVGLAGFVDAARPDADGARFAFVANGDFSTATGETLQDQISESIGAYVDAPSAPNPLPPPE